MAGGRSLASGVGLMLEPIPFTGLELSPGSGVVLIRMLSLEPRPHLSQSRSLDHRCEFLNHRSPLRHRPEPRFSNGSPKSTPVLPTTPL